MDTPHNDLESIRRILADLTTRVYHIERRLQMEVSLAESRAPSAAAPPPQPQSSVTSSPSPSEKPTSLFTPSSHIPPKTSVFLPVQPAPDLESRIGSHWLNRIGIAAVLIGVSYFLKFAFDNSWIGPSGRVTIGLLAGIAMVVWSERFRSKGFKAFSYSLKAVGIGALYLSLWAAFQVYSLVPSGVAFVMMLAVTAATAAMALAQDAQILAAFALTGGFSTPLLLSTGQNREIALFPTWWFSISRR
jgi:uncharacterized membrane protein